jgi:hypothetical protein
MVVSPVECARLYGSIVSLEVTWYHDEDLVTPDNFFSERFLDVKIHMYSDSI